MVKKVWEMAATITRKVYQIPLNRVVEYFFAVAVHIATIVKMLKHSRVWIKGASKVTYNKLPKML